MNQNNSMENGDQRPAHNLTSLLILLIIGAVLLITAIIFYPETRLILENRPTPGILSETKLTETIQVTYNPAPTKTPGLPTTPEPSPTSKVYSRQADFGFLILAIREGLDYHLFAYQPFLEETDWGDFSALPLTRLTAGPHQDRHPAVSPDGRNIAFSSNREGQWDLYILDLETGVTNRFTNSAAYDGNPTWSPDGQWIAYESYHLNNLEIFIQDIEGSIGPIPLTNHPAADYAPDWSGEGRKISFISTRNGRQEVWYADLDSPEEDKALQIPNFPGRHAKHPTWTGDGRYLSWSVVTDDGNHTIVTWDSENPDRDPIPAGSGDWPIWTGTGKILYTLVENPYQMYLTGYPGIQDDLQVMLPAVKLPGHADGISWTPALPFLESVRENSDYNPTPLYNPILEIEPEEPVEKKELVQIEDLQTTYPFFHPDAAKTFKKLREQTRNHLGWDFLGTLENAYKPLTDQSVPGIYLEWLHTGRAMSVNDIPRLADWMVVTKEEFGTQTYWRLYIRTNNQQGRQGMPLKDYPWDFAARYSGSNQNYEDGGAFSNKIPEGYWIDFTDLADAFGWKRFPAQSFWQFSETAARFQYFSFTQDLPLKNALLELYSESEIQFLLD